MAEEHAEFMQKLRKGLSMLVNRKLALGYKAWQERVFGVADDPMAKALRHMMNRGLSRGLAVLARELGGGEGEARVDAQEPWPPGQPRAVEGLGRVVEMAIGAREFMQKLRKGLSIMVNRKLALGFASWTATLRFFGGEAERMVTCRAR